jgi:hypothetical protein
VHGALKGVGNVIVPLVVDGLGFSSGLNGLGPF